MHAAGTLRADAAEAMRSLRELAGVPASPDPSPPPHGLPSGVHALQTVQRVRDLHREAEELVLTLYDAAAERDLMIEGHRAGPLWLPPGSVSEALFAEGGYWRVQYDDGAELRLTDRHSIRAAERAADRRDLMGARWWAHHGDGRLRLWPRPA